MNTAVIGKSLAALTFAALSLGALQAHADDYSETLVTSEGVRTQAVSVADLDLQSAGDRERLYHRLSNAAREVCGPADHRVTGHLGAAADNQACYRRALDEALSQVNAGQVASID